MQRREFTSYLLGAAAGPLLASGFAGRRVPRQPTQVNRRRLLRTMREQARIGATRTGGVSRVAYTEADREARAYATELMRGAGLQVRVDAAANIIGYRPGRDEDRSPLLIGSHIDSVPDGGAYDGNVGSFSAIEVAATLNDHDERLRHPLEVVIFQNEEGGLVGSEAIAGSLTADQLDRVSQSGKTIREGIAYLGGDPDNLDAARRQPGEIAAYVEEHIEQGALLEQAGLDIGVVEGIVGIWWWTVTIEGFANHAGTTPMDQRRDALLAGARFVDAVNRVVTSEPGRQVGTVGRIEASPGAPNVIPGRVVTSLELRDLNAEKTSRLFERIRNEAEMIGRATGTSFTFVDQELNIVPALTNPGIRQTIAACCTSLNLSYRMMPSGAGHDAQSLAALAPIGMLFIPSGGGISHSPREFSRSRDIVNGANVLLHTVLELDDDL